MTTKRVESLTPEQIAKLAEYRDRWLRIGLSTEPTNRAAGTAAVAAAYRAAGLEPPEIVIWLGSPLAGAIGAAMLVGLKHINALKVGAQVWAQVVAQVWAQVVDQVGAQVVDQVGDQVGDLASIGFDAEWTTVRADEVGAPHRRERLFILAYADSGAIRQLAERVARSRRRGRATVGENAEPGSAGENGVGLANAGRARPQERDGEYGDDGAEFSPAVGGGAVGDTGEQRIREPSGSRGAVDGEGTRRASVSASNHVGQADADSAGCGKQRRELSEDRDAQSGDDTHGRGGEAPVADALGVRRRQGRAESEHGRRRASADIGSHSFPPGPSRIAEWRGPPPAIPRAESAIRGSDDGSAGQLDSHLSCLRWRADRLRLCGNGVVPHQAALALRILVARALAFPG